MPRTAKRTTKQIAGITGTHSQYREVADFYPTCSEAVTSLLEVEKFSGPIWEPACGDGAISAVLKVHGYTVISSDLYDYGYADAVSAIDFISQYSNYKALLYSAWPNRTKIHPSTLNIVTNPPFALSLEFAERALEVTKDNPDGKVAMLNRLQWLEGVKRGKFFSKHPPSRVWVYSKRLPRMHARNWEGKKTSSMIAFAWFVWDIHHKGPTLLGWLDYD